MTPALPAGVRPTTPVSSDSAASARTRSGFALTGPSVPLDPRTHAIRPDLADIRLAGRVFAPHFAAAIRCRATRPVGVTDSRQAAEAVARLTVGDPFEVLEISGDVAWGIATGPRLVGYVDRDALEMDE